MKLSEAATLARNLITAHGFPHVKFAFNRRKNALGVCRYSAATRQAVSIELSEHWVPHLSESEVRDTILHEIAHAMTPGAHHGPEWKAAARKVGANPKRTAEDVPQDVQQRIVALSAKYRASCTKCDNVIYFNRMGKKWKQGAYVCGRCRGKLRVTHN